MKVLILNTRDISGGAAKAIYRIHRGLRSRGVDSRMLVQSKESDDYTVMSSATTGLGKEFAKIRTRLDALPLKFYSKRKKVFFSVNLLPDSVPGRVREIKPDIVQLNWVGDGFLRIETLKDIQRPLVWRLPDMWAFTGGCHYDEDCGRYVHSCGRCPVLGSEKDNDLSRSVWGRKKKAWKHLNISIVTPSKWLAECARLSSIFRNARIEIIPNGIDVVRFKPIEKYIAREILSLPQNKKIILFGSESATSDPRKGYHLLLSALKKVTENHAGFSKIELLIFGSSAPSELPDLGFPAHYLGRLSDDISLSVVYSAADVFVAPSSQENFANTVLEAMACGIPSVAFKIGGMPDLIEHQKNGYLAEPFDTADLADGIGWVIDSGERYSEISKRARQRVEDEFNSELQTDRYLALYKDILDLNNG